MNAIRLYTHSRYQIGSHLSLTDSHFKILSRHFETPADITPEGLGGRAQLTVVELPGFGSCLIKPYFRGGFIRHFVKRHHFKWGKTRPQMEYELLQQVSQTGVGVPNPVAFAHTGNLFYKAWLVTGYISGTVSLAELGQVDPDSALRVLPDVIADVAALIDGGIWHIDLHPGNVLVDSKGAITVVDFDKCRFFSGSPKQICRRYISRWQRAVSKYGLPNFLSDDFGAELNRIYA